MMQSGNEPRSDELPARSNLRSIFDDQYVLLLAVRPGDEILGCGGLIAESCARGRPPLVCIVTDGSSDAAESSPDEVAQSRAERSRAATAMLDLPRERLLLFGLYDKSVPQAGALFQRLVDAVADIVRRYDCNVLCAPFQPQPAGDDFAVQKLAEMVAARAGLTLIWHASPTWTADFHAVGRGAARVLDIARHATQKRVAAQMVTGRTLPCIEPFESFLLCDRQIGQSLTKCTCAAQ
jgi:LmbE family N-acetylglucosaminyl deacetylase